MKWNKRVKIKAKWARIRIGKHENKYEKIEYRDSAAYKIYKMAIFWSFIK